MRWYRQRVWKSHTHKNQFMWTQRLISGDYEMESIRMLNKSLLQISASVHLRFFCRANWWLILQLCWVDPWVQFFGESSSFGVISSLNKASKLGYDDVWVQSNSTDKGLGQPVRWLSNSFHQRRPPRVSLQEDIVTCFANRSWRSSNPGHPDHFIIRELIL